MKFVIIQIVNLARVFKGDLVMDLTKNYEILKVKGKEEKQVSDKVILEYPFTIFINDEELITLLCTPKSLKELTIGFLYSEGFIEKMESIERILVDEKKGLAHVYLKERKLLAEKLYGKRTITSGCGKGTLFYNVIDSFKSKKIEEEFNIDIDRIVNLFREFNLKSELFLSTGGVHSCALCTLNEILYFEEDIRRHNALDKILGEALINNVKYKDKLVLTTGRISSEMLIKIAKRGIPAIISRSAPTNLAIDLANKLNITVIGFVRGDKMNIYTNY